MERDALGEAMILTREAHVRLCDTIETLDDSSLRSDSLLPGWTRAHVLSHLARNAESHVRMLTAASRGETVEQYADGHVGRARDIEEGTGKDLRALTEDVYASASRLFDTWGELPPDVWDREVTAIHGRQPAWHCVFSRWRETEIHRVDLGAGYSWRDWQEPFSRSALASMLSSISARVPPGVALEVHSTDTAQGGRWGNGSSQSKVRAPAALLVAWLSGRPFDRGRMDVDGDLPDLGPWA